MTVDRLVFPGDGADCTPLQGLILDIVDAGVG